MDNTRGFILTQGIRRPAKRFVGLPGVLMVVALVAAACGGATAGSKIISPVASAPASPTSPPAAVDNIEHEPEATSVPELPAEPTAVSTQSAPESSPSPEPDAIQVVETVRPEPTVLARAEFDTSAFAEIKPGGPRDVDPLQFRQIFGRDSIVPIYEPRIVSVAETETTPEELVMGVAINGEARAYPVSQMRYREMANDELGGVPILVTW